MNEQKKKPKIFGLGMSRTGTSSLGEALNQLGINTIHFPYDATTQKELSSGASKLSILERYQGIVDISIVPFYKKLDVSYVNSKFILTLRNIDSWLESVRNSLETTMRNWNAYELQYRKFFRFINNRVYGSCNFDRTRFAEAFHSHVEDVTSYFHERPADLLIMNFADGDNWRKLCPFLGVPEPKTPFPRTNDSIIHLDWIEKLGAVKRDLDSVIHCGVPFVLIDHSALDVIDIGEHRKGKRPLLEWGKPLDDTSAIDALEQRRREGAEYLVVAWPAFWWLQHYSGLTRYLDGQYLCVLRNERVVIYSLCQSKDKDGFREYPN